MSLHVQPGRRDKCVRVPRCSSPRAPVRSWSSLPAENAFLQQRLKPIQYATRRDGDLPHGQIRTLASRNHTALVDTERARRVARGAGALPGVMREQRAGHVHGEQIEVSREEPGLQSVASAIATPCLRNRSTVAPASRAMCGGAGQHDRHRFRRRQGGNPLFRQDIPDGRPTARRNAMQAPRRRIGQLLGVGPASPRGLRDPAFRGRASGGQILETAPPRRSGLFDDERPAFDKPVAPSVRTPRGAIHRRQIGIGQKHVFAIEKSAFMDISTYITSCQQVNSRHGNLGRIGIAGGMAGPKRSASAIADDGEDLRRSNPDTEPHGHRTGIRCPPQPIATAMPFSGRWRG